MSLRCVAAAGLTGGAAVIVATAATATAAPAPTAQPPSPPVTPRHGRPFTPAQGDWEGATRGFTASFELGFDSRAGRYALTRLVLLRPNACPADPARYSEFFLRAPARVPLGRFGSLQFGSAGVSTMLHGARSATLTSTYRVGACTGTLAWRMHPARRAVVEDGTWSIRFGRGAPSRFTVGSGGRLARGIPLPPVPAGCNGLRGALDLFIPARGRATVTQSGVTVGLRFTRRSATGTLRLAGCPAGSLGIRATRL